MECPLPFWFEWLDAFALRGAGREADRGAGRAGFGRDARAGAAG